MGHLRPPSPAARATRGFTLIELMTTVVIVGVLAVAAYAGYHKFVTTSHQAEANNMLSGIKERQENFKAEVGAYLNVSTVLAANQNTSSFGDHLFPMCATGKGLPGAVKVAWPGGGYCTASCCSGWAKLKVQSTAPTYYGFSTVAGLAADPLPAFSLGANSTVFPAPSGPWFVATGVADTDGNGVFTTSMISSFDNEIHIDHDGE